MRSRVARTAAPLLIVLAAVACEGVDDDRIPLLPVSINLRDAGMWNAYGVAGTGLHREFIMQEREPAGFPYVQGSATGFGGVLLVSGMDPFTTDTNVPLAYDLACPVERQPDVRVFISDDNLDAVCPDCGSHYNAVTGGGAPLSGPAATGEHKYGLRRYRCLPSGYGGYYITD